MYEQLQAKQRQILFTEFTSQMKKVRGVLFEILGHHSLQSQFAVQSEYQKASKSLKVSFATSNLGQLALNQKFHILQLKNYLCFEPLQQRSKPPVIHENIVLLEQKPFQY